MLAFAIVAVAALTACGSSPGNTARADAGDALGTSMSFTSHRSSSAIASCLASRIGSVRRSIDGAATKLAVGGNTQDYAWLITLTPASAGTLVKVRIASDKDGPVPEPDMRFFIARCTA
jgi:hypothetical protein